MASQKSARPQLVLASKPELLQSSKAQTFPDSCRTRFHIPNLVSLPNNPMPERPLAQRAERCAPEPSPQFRCLAQTVKPQLWATSVQCGSQIYSWCPLPALLTEASRKSLEAIAMNPKLSNYRAAVMQLMSRQASSPHSKMEHT